MVTGAAGADFPFSSISDAAFANGVAARLASHSLLVTVFPP
jgi:hypothetical protein